MKLLQRVLWALLLLLFVGVGCVPEAQKSAIPCSALFRASNDTLFSAAGYASDVYIDLEAPAGSHYTISVVEGGKWCWTSRTTHATSKSDKMMISTRSEKIYLAQNSGEHREAIIEVAFEGYEPILLHLSQGSYDKPAHYAKPWAELPDYMESATTVTVTHYTEIAADKVARNFTLCYDTEKCYANWVAYPLHDCYMNGTYKRSNAWAYDPKIPTNQQANLARGSYSGYGWVRGHQVMSNHRYVPYSEELNAQTYYSTNIMPQAYDFNGGVWLDMENKCTAAAKGKIDTLYCVTGAHGIQGYTTDKAGKRVAIPEYCFKVLLRSKSGKSRKAISEFTSADELIAIGYWAPNNDSSNSKSVKHWTCSVAEVEAHTGYRFFTMLPESIAAEVKRQHNPSDWGIN